MALSFLFLTRNAGAALDPCAAQIAACTRPGDQVVVLDDGSDDTTVRHIGRFEELHGWGEGVTAKRIVTAHDPQAGHRQGYDLAAPLAVAAATRPYVMLLTPATPPVPAAIEAARSLIEAEEPDLVCHITDGAEPEAARAALLSVFGVILRRQTLFSDPAHQGPAAGELPLLWQGLRPGSTLATAPAPLVQGDAPPLASGLGLLQGGIGILASEPETRGKAAALAWILGHLPALLAGHRAGAVAAILRAATALRADCPPDLWAAALTGAPPDVAALWDDPKSATTMLTRMRLARQLSAPPRGGHAPLRVALEGRHAQRMPLSYAALAPLWEGRIEQTSPGAADLLLFAHPQDVASPRPEVARALDARPRPVALLSEEPFWDTMFSPDPLADRVALAAGPLGELRLHQINHHTSDIFDFARLPYYLLTNHRFSVSYAARFARNARRTPQDWATMMAAAPVQTLFMAERRPEPFHDVAFPDGDVIGLCAWRTRLAETCSAAPVERIGASWQGGPTRFEIADWHLDKLVNLDGRARLLSGVENTHQPTYLSEKLFDAFACGARPFYVASHGHRLHDLGLPEGAWINLWGQEAAAAAATVDATSWGPDFWGPDFFRDYAVAQTRLAELFGDSGLVVAERARVRAAVLNTLEITAAQLA